MMHVRPSLSPRRLAFAVLVLATVSGCTVGTDFWRQCSCVQSRYAGASDLSGCWHGCWRSDNTSHNGKLRAVITPCGNGRYHLRFHGTFFKLLSFEYEIDMTAQATDTGYYVSGQKDLGQLVGGVFYYSGQVTGDDFVVNYRSCKDHGVFILRRQRCGNCCQ